ncbi:nucleotidyltransferase [Halalkalibacter kiskunsagensis]|uniref:tRNA(Met) cytidine acetate ligase n=1 Tax=Halalkalibacter kiskunsagensis TaxID=1548599 RepID=A0ABV6KIB6_9BACI
MKAVGIVVEYNPFHNGHHFQVTKARQITNADVVIAVMSASFLQRGEPAIVSKWFRTQMALACGVDIVIELPYIYSTQKAETFANGAISLLAEMGVNFINFGSESGNIQDFEHLLTFMRQNKVAFDRHVKENMKLGYSYPRATSTAFTQLNPDCDTLSLTEPNNILGFHYMKAIQDQGYSIQATTTLRRQAHYHDQQISEGSIASATSIRQAIQNGELSEIKHVMPTESYQLLKSYKQTYSLLHTWQDYYDLLQYKVLSTPVTHLRMIYECEEGLEYRVKNVSKRATSFSDWMQQLKTKRYTWTRLQRLATHILTNTTKLEMKEALSQQTPEYIRLLGMNTLGQAYLNQSKKNRSVPLITKPAKAKGITAFLEERATNIYLSPLSSEVRRKEMSEQFSRHPIIAH